MGIIKRLFLPNQYVKSIHEIDFDELHALNIKGVITDLDNTLVGWDEADPTPKVQEWFKGLEDRNMKVTIVSNNNEKRVKSFCQNLNVDYIFKAKKPRGKSLRRATHQMGLEKDTVVVIGDQMLTDVFGGNRSGLYTIMVVPVKNSDGFITKFNRLLERRLLNHFKRKGYIKWEES
ncbi:MULTISPECIES: YqeG family HAD IIIA-type phosphatase [Staphylococcus]|uniref:YqeG family HAD IIIA-type phosphatase n=1 Tax=Staphylococcus coagulans TaxID=74706 RepID=A0A9X1E4F4_9STAP|nr:MULTISPECIES: YqeG family HAD IIIA-type phosphatase [Staphylococcus]NHA36079.1 YqeG family HAD IIIA-type phosphatase [Staphylococcus schleiferi]MBA8771665.1 YqeG family HAD IIIA-type phosphatase [Staphylococcus coagulans]MBA8775346.1 YqeG family HAD IIIA-type phosphatase [Staphylococcus coagulans]MBT2829493.1 YqeG family HAD IIIA-type phosphatase [Staphylococcus coagulans]MBT2858968.1 YqeG family HAD IIIA-type phosphatase [Staphylococcus coagulans]